MAFGLSMVRPHSGIEPLGGLRPVPQVPARFLGGNLGVGSLRVNPG